MNTTRFEIERLEFSQQAVKSWAPREQHNTNWPVVYILDDADRGTRAWRSGVLDNVYVGETLNADKRMRQHLGSPEKQQLRTIRVIIDETFNKSVCLDLESYLIRLFAGDGTYRVLNRNDGITEADYFDRAKYRETFREVFDHLLRDGVFTRGIPEIENSDLFKLSPFKALSQDQAIAVEDILEGLFAHVKADVGSTSVIQGDPGTGKTVIGIYLIKLLVDIARSMPQDDIDGDSLFSEFFVPGYPELLRDFRIGLVVPQQSLRKSIQKVFRKTPGLSADMVMTPFEVGVADQQIDLLVVDEAHRLNQRANQPSASQNKKFQDVTEKLFGADDKTKTQLDWIRAKSKHQIFLLDAAQSVRPADVPQALLEDMVFQAQRDHRYYPLLSQMRVQAGSDYVGYIRRIFGTAPALGEPTPVAPETFDGYDFRMFDDVAEMRDQIHRKDAEGGLARMVAGYAWEWKTKNDKTAFDIQIDETQFRWNGTQVDWIASKGSLEEVGSIHTVQGYDLNYAGVIIGNDLRYDPLVKRLFIDRASYFDKKGKENNPALGKTYTDDDLLRFITNIYAVLLTRGIRGTYVYVCDPALRAHLKQFIPSDPA
ncbi:DNA/RNA helicase domain-containing protein [Parafrigoribacterium soli]|uniref:DNA/RNA helicase domain-containing protein n=1 Tax=Parafrigoribacterium soli TaxID=3144663 RepID=UPI0032ED3426